MFATKQLLLFFWLTTLCLQYVTGYRKYYIEDECMPSKKKQKILLQMPAVGPDSVGEIRSNRFGTYSRTERNCVLKLIPPNGYGVVLTVLKIDFRDHGTCKDFIEISSDGNEEEKLCGYHEFGLENQTYFSEDEIDILYHTSGDGMGFNKGIQLIFTVANLAQDGCSNPDQFKCVNSHCIWAGVTCDGINNCGDASDEQLLEYPFCPEVSPLAITAFVLGITSFITIAVGLCICCCHARTEQPEKPFLLRQYSTNGGYMPLPGYNYGSTANTLRYIQPVHSNVSPSAPTQFIHRCANSNVPLVQQKGEIRYDRPPPPYIP